MRTYVRGIRTADFEELNPVVFGELTPLFLRKVAPLFMGNFKPLLTHILQLAGTWSNHMNVSIVLSSFHMTDGMPDSTILVLRAQSDAGDLPELAHHMSAIANELKHLRIPVNLDPYITGYIQPLLSQEETNQVITKAFDTVDAKRIEGVTSNLVTSISGYSPEGPTYIMSKEKMNLQAALQWDGYNQHTSVVVGTPIIVDPY